MILRKVPILFLGLAFSSAVQAEIYFCTSANGQWFTKDGIPLGINLEGEVFIVDTSRGIKAEDDYPTAGEDEYFGSCQSYGYFNHFCHTQSEGPFITPHSILVNEDENGEITFSASVLGVGPKFLAGKCVKT